LDEFFVFLVNVLEVGYAFAYFALFSGECFEDFWNRCFAGLTVGEPADETLMAQLLKTSGLHLADAQVLALAREHKGVAVTDDEIVGKTA
jgi:hypothetical protein